MNWPVQGPLLNVMPPITWPVSEMARRYLSRPMMPLGSSFSYPFKTKNPSPFISPFTNSVAVMPTFLAYSSGALDPTFLSVQTIFPRMEPSPVVAQALQPAPASNVSSAVKTNPVGFVQMPRHSPATPLVCAEACKAPNKSMHIKSRIFFIVFLRTRPTTASRDSFAAGAFCRSPLLAEPFQKAIRLLLTAPAERESRAHYRMTLFFLESKLRNRRKPEVNPELSLPNTGPLFLIARRSLLEQTGRAPAAA